MDRCLLVPRALALIPYFFHVLKYLVERHVFVAVAVAAAAVYWCKIMVPMLGAMIIWLPLVLVTVCRWQPLAVPISNVGVARSASAAIGG